MTKKKTDTLIRVSKEDQEMLKDVAKKDYRSMKAEAHIAFVERADKVGGTSSD